MCLLASFSLTSCFISTSRSHLSSSVFVVLFALFQLMFMSFGNSLSRLLFAVIFLASFFNFLSLTIFCVFQNSESARTIRRSGHIPSMRSCLMIPPPLLSFRILCKPHIIVFCLFSHLSLCIVVLAAYMPHFFHVSQRHRSTTSQYISN